MAVHLTKSLVVPIFRRYWLWHAWTDASVAASRPPLKPWKEGSTLEEKVSLLGQNITNTVMQRVMKEWRLLEAAKEGTLRNKGYRLAQAVLSREDPRETFLKHVPRDESAEVRFFYPDEIQEKLVRRRLRLLVHEGKRRHRTRLLWWSLALVPQLPLMLTPLPNITVYYTIYRIVSHVQALQGSKAIERGFAALDSQHLAELRDSLLRLQHEHGISFPQDSWPARLIKRESKYLDIFDRLRRLHKQRRLEEQRKISERQTETTNDVPSADNILRQSGWKGTVYENFQQRIDGIRQKSRLWWRTDKMPEYQSATKSNDRSAEQGKGEVLYRSGDDSVDHENERSPRTGENGTSSTEERQAAALGSNHLIKPQNDATSSSIDMQACTGMRLVFKGSSELSDVLKPTERLKIPLGDAAAMTVAREFDANSLMETVARARRRAVGSMFPTHVPPDDTKQGG